MKNNPSWNLFLDHVYTYAYCKNLFTKEECEQIIGIGKKKILTNAKTKEETNLRKSSISWLYSIDNLDWAFKKISDVVIDLNKKYFSFDIFGFNEGLQFTNYKAPSGKYGKHIDRTHGINVRKLSLSIQLNNPKDYKGGELWLYEDDKGIEMNKEQGTLILFPSYILHEVKPMIKGERNSLVTWITGKPFK